MGKRSKKINMHTVLVPGSVKQGMLFEDAFTDIQQSVLDAADGTRTVQSIAFSLDLAKDKTLQIINKLQLDGYLRTAEAVETLEACEVVIKLGRLDDGISLYKYVLQDDSENLEVMAKLATLYERTAHAKEAAGLYKSLTERYVASARYGEALVALRKAAGLQSGNFKVQDDLAKLCIKTGRTDEAARVWRAYAMRLAGAGEYAHALDIIDTAGREIAGSDTLLFAEAEILALMEGKGKASNQLHSQEVITVDSEGVTSDVVVDMGTEPYLEGGGVVNELPLPEAVEEDPGLVLDMSNPLFVDEDLDTVEDEIITGKYESDRDYSTLRLRNYKNEYTPKKGRGAWIALGLFICILLVLAGVNYYYRAKMYSAVMESRGIGSLMQDANLLEKIEIGDSALEVLERSKPPFEFMQSSEFVNQEARLLQLVRDSDALLLKNNLEFDAKLSEWAETHNPTLAQLFLEYSMSNSIGSRRRVKAENVYNDWLKEKDQKARDLHDYIEVLANKKLDPQLRFSAYRNILLNFPSAFSKQYPLGVKGLTVPSRIISEIGSTGKSIKLNIIGAKQGDKGYWEIPVEADSNVIIEHRGYEFEYDSSNNGSTRMPYPLTFEQLFVVKKSPVLRMTVGMDFIPEIGIKIDSIQGFAFSSRNDFALFDSSTSEVILRDKLVRPRSDEALSVGIDLFGLGEWVGVVSDGVVYATQIKGASLSPELKVLAGSELASVIYAGFYDLELGEYNGVGAVISNYFSPESPDKQNPLEVLEVGSGRNVWAKKEIQDRLSKGLISPICSVARIGWYFALVSVDGSVTLLMENGDIYKTFDIELEKGERLAKNMVKWIHRNGKEYLAIEGRIFRFDQSSEVNLVELWELEKKDGKEIFISKDGVVEYGGGEIVAYNINNGSKLFEYNYKGKIESQPVSVSGKMVFATLASEKYAPSIFAVNLQDVKEPLVWDYELNSDPVLLFKDSQRAYVFTKNKTLLGFDG